MRQIDFLRFRPASRPATGGLCCFWVAYLLELRTRDARIAPHGVSVESRFDSCRAKSSHDRMGLFQVRSKEPRRLVPGLHDREQQAVQHPGNDIDSRAPLQNVEWRKIPLCELLEQGSMPWGRLDRSRIDSYGAARSFLHSFTVSKAFSELGSPLAVRARLGLERKDCKGTFNDAFTSRP